MAHKPQIIVLQNLCFNTPIVSVKSHLHFLVYVPKECFNTPIVSVKCERGFIRGQV